MLDVKRFFPVSSSFNKRYFTEELVRCPGTFSAPIFHKRASRQVPLYILRPDMSQKNSSTGAPLHSKTRYFTEEQYTGCPYNKVKLVVYLLICNIVALGPQQDEF